MKVSFLKAPTGGIIGLEMITFVEPLGLECVAGGLERHGHECQIVDLRIDGFDKGIAKAVAFEPAIVGLQVNFTTERYRALRVVSEIKRLMPQALVVLGGHDASRDPRWFLKPGVDIVAVGDGEEIMPALVETFEKGGNLKNVRGLVLNNANGPVDTGPATARRNLDELPMPARHLIEDYANEYYINFRRPLALVETARGCPFKCNFCSVWKFHESTFREKSPERVVEELAQVKAPNVFITDDIFWLNVKRGRALAAALKESGIKKHFTIQTRSDIVCKFHKLIEQWKECGKMTVFLGLEKIDDEGLKGVNKHNSAAKNDRAIEILQDMDVGYTPNFIIDPDWQPQDFDKLKSWIDRTGAYNSGFSILTPLPGTDLWDDVQDQVVTEDWELFDIVHTVLPTKMPLEDFYREYASLWQHTLNVRFRDQGRVKAYVGLLYALATGKVTLGAMRKGMRLGMANVLANPETFLAAHRDSEERLAKARSLIGASPQPDHSAAALQ